MRQAPVLLREHIRRCLTGPASGYFTRTGAGAQPVGELPRRIPFPELRDEAAYRAWLARAYAEDLQASWLTPSSIFSPTYGQAVANFLLHEAGQRPAGEPLCIVEVGGGTGVLAEDILDKVRAVDAARYARAAYHSLEVSPACAAQQAARLQPEHAAAFRVTLGDATSAAAWQRLPPARHAYILLCEVLDNLPHDRCRGPASEGAAWEEAVVGEDDQGALQETFRELSDPLAEACLAAWQRTQVAGQGSWGAWVSARLLGRRQDVYLPTGCLQLLRAAAGRYPSHTLLAADFDALPDTPSPAHNAPLVSYREGGRTVDCPDYLGGRAADIFFPTDFALLGELYRGSLPPGLQGAGEHAKAHAFLLRYAPVAACSTRTGYNPLLQDFANTAVFVGRSSPGA